jgi:hypothetical protein
MLGVVVCGVEVNTSFGSDCTVTVCVAEVKPAALAVMVGVPAALSRYRKLAVLAPSAMVTDVMFAVSAALRNTPPPAVDDRLTTSEPEVIAVAIDVSR